MIPYIIGGLALGALAATGYAIWCDSEAEEEQKRAAKAAAASRQAQHRHHKWHAEQRRRADFLAGQATLVALGEARACLAQAEAIAAELRVELRRPGLAPARRRRLGEQLREAEDKARRYSTRVQELWAWISNP